MNEVTFYLKKYISTIWDYWDDIKYLWSYYGNTEDYMFGLIIEKVTI